MKFKEFLGSRAAGLVAGTVTVVLGGGAVAALAFGSPAPESRRMGDSRLSAGNQAFVAALVANAGANDLGSASGSGDGLADGSPIAGRMAAERTASAVDVSAGDGSPMESGRVMASGASARPGSADYYRALLTAGSIGGMGTMAMLPRGASGRRVASGNLAGDLTGSGAAYTRDPLVPSRAFSNYGSNDAGSSASTSGNAANSASSRPVGGPSAVGAVSNNGGSAARPGGSAPITSPILAPPSSANGTASSVAVPSSRGNSSPGSLVSSQTPAATDPLGEHRTPARSDNVVNQPGRPAGTTPGTRPLPPTTSVISADAILTPEPGTWLLVGSGLLALGLVGRRRAGRLG